MSLIDATYKTTKYDLPLFFVTVRTNVGYKVVAHFIVQSETTEHACTRQDCGRCVNCLDKKKFNGLGRKKKNVVLNVNVGI